MLTKEISDVEKEIKEIEKKILKWGQNVIILTNRKDELLMSNRKFEELQNILNDLRKINKKQKETSHAN
jgi:dissimilatory sulfite reductase (desulfoviridin) alpha/beta subunit